MSPHFLDRFAVSLSYSPSYGRIVRVALAILVLTPLFAIGFFQYTREYNYATATILARRLTIVHLAATLIEERFDRLKNIASSLATRVQFRKFVEGKKWSDAIAILKDIPQQFPFIDRVFLTDPNGIETAALGADISVVGKDFSSRDWYKGVTAANAPYISEVYRRTTAPQYNIIAIAAPIQSASGTTTGILVMQLKLDELYEWPREVEHVGSSISVYFFDQRGYVAAHPRFRPQDDIADFSFVPIVQKALSGKEGTEVTTGLGDGGEYVTAYHPVAGYGWGVAITEPTLNAFAERNKRLREILFIDGIIGLLAIIFLYLLTQFINTVAAYRQKESSILKGIGDGLVAIDRDWRITLFNRAASALTGFTEEEALGKPFRDVLKFIREKDRKENIAFIEEAMVYGRTGYVENNTLLVKKDGTEIPVNDSAAPVFDVHGKVSGAIIIFRDSSKERDANLLRSDFAYASHQLRTPVNKALWGLEMALVEKRIPAMRAAVSDAYLSIRSINRTMAELLDVSEIDQGRVIPSPEKCVLRKLLEDAAAKIASETKKRGAALNIVAVPAVNLSTDPRLAQAALAEILLNAVLYSAPGAEVAVRARKETDGVTIEVQDFGIGIPAAQQALVFTKFFRGNNIDTVKSVGGGLGLFIAHEYVKLLKGKIWFTSQEGKGTTFFVFLPAKAE